MQNVTTAVIVSAKQAIKIYTKNGDAGYTKNILGNKKLKSSMEFNVVGSLDELNASLGLISTTGKKLLLKEILLIQADLFKIGAYFSGLSFKPKDVDWVRSRIIAIENTIDIYDGQNAPLKNFILPGGTFESAHLHFSRTVCRRAERILVDYLEKNKSKKELSILLQYFNRLSDLLFVYARFFNQKGKKDILWKP